MDELAEWLSLMDAMRATHGGGGACCCKILAYEILFTREQLPALSARYAVLYADLYGYDTTGRDFLVEVRAALRGDTAGPAAEPHKRVWRQLPLELALTHGFYRP